MLELSKIKSLPVSNHRLIRNAIAIFAAAILCGNLDTTWSLSSREAMLATVLESKNFVWVMLTWVLVSAAFPVFGRITVVVASLIYLTQRELWISLFLPSAFLILALSGSIDATKVLRRRFAISASYQWLLTICVLFFFLPCFPWILLGVHLLTPPVLIAGAGMFALLFRYLVQQAYEPAPTRDNLDTLGSFFLTLVYGAIFASALFYLFPDAINGDSDKAYAAYPKFYAVTNSLVLTEPGWTGVDNVMALYHHTQEMFLAAGWALGENNGLKLFALAIVIAKLWTVYFLGHGVLKLTRSQAWGAVALYAWLPVTVEIHGIIRPENLLTLYTLLIAIAFENLRNATESARAFWAALSLLLIALGISVKLTGIYMIFACGLFYFPECWTIIQLLCKKDRWALLSMLVSVLITAFWFARNYIRWGLLLNMSPFGQYHLTIWHPPIRRADEWWMMFTQSLVKVSRFTEFSNFGYGIVGILFFAVAFFSLTRSGVVRRLAGLILIYTFMLFISTRQIRYILPVAPLAALLVVHWAVEVMEWCRAREAWSPQIVGNWGRAGLIFHLLFALLVLQDSYLYEHLWRRFHSFVLGKGVYQSAVVDLNKKLNFSDHVLSPYLDFNYGLNARMFRGEPYNSLDKLVSAQRLHSFDYWLLHWAEAQMSENTYFNDPALIGELAELVIKAAPEYDPTQWLALYRPSLPLLERVEGAVRENGFDPKSAIVVSDARWREHELDLFHPQPIFVKDLATDLHVLTARWDEMANRYIAVADSAPEQLRGWNFADIGASDSLGVNCVAPRSSFSRAECVIKIPEGQGGGAQAIGVTSESGRQLILKIFVRGDSTKPAQKLYELTSAHGRKPLSRMLQLTKWTEIASERVTAGEELVLRSSADLVSKLGREGSAPRFVLVSSQVAEPRGVELGGVELGLALKQTPIAPRFKTTVTAAGVQSVSGAPASAVSPPILKGMVTGKLQPESERFNPGRVTLQMKLPPELSRDITISVTAEKLQISSEDTVNLVVTSSANRDSEDVLPLYSAKIEGGTSCATNCQLGTFNLATVPGVSGRDLLRLSIVITNASSGKSSIESVTVQAARRTSEQPDIIDRFDLRNLSPRARELGVVDDFRSGDEFRPILQRGEATRELQAAQIGNVAQIGNTLHAAQIKKPGFATYKISIPDELRNRPLQVILRAVGRTYQEGDKVAFHIKRGKNIEAALATGSMLSPATDSARQFYETSVVMPANQTALTIDVDCILVSTEASDRALIRALAIVAGDAGTTAGDQTLQ